MSLSEKENPRSPEHLEAQRNRILDASEECFIKYGFHAASMARIAETAGISQGLAYRYFKNKSAIILAIIERQLAQRNLLSDGTESVDDFADKIVELVREWSAREDGKISPVLFLEMCSEASRDKEIEAALAKADQTYKEDFSAWIRGLAEREGKEMSDSEIDRRFTALQGLVEGSALLAARRGAGRESEVLRNEMLIAFVKQTLSVD
ncbi:helix-turn-helix domain-containing protein [Pelagicoccus sp. SDUM812003]|uniref:TetR/AcrR family transcriptional regulator n=1 Tax=Pelagicoccus sp. SDUM812003 TaxID=3041267 RepID=UPI00280E7D0F|nr:helix-turn-helix domain-containing protein [Pelagicoccus sp. SDUM812003]MDQ8203393.1 helix-turn-helix domain containing protein [Pelagicoccus sp. SDUM812003]